MSAVVSRGSSGSASRAYRSARDHVEGVVAFARALLERRAHAGEPQRLEALDLEIARCGEDLARGLAGARAQGFVLPLERVRAAFQLDPAEQRCLYLLLALAVSAEVRELAGSPDGTAAV